MVCDKSRQGITLACHRNTEKGINRVPGNHDHEGTQPHE